MLLLDILDLGRELSVGGLDVLDLLGERRVLHLGGEVLDGLRYDLGLDEGLGLVLVELVV
jgi:hypothetical protein